jgi:hypothetical protein
MLTPDDLAILAALLKVVKQWSIPKAVNGIKT